MPPKKGSRKHREVERERKRQERQQESEESRTKRLEQKRAHDEAKKLSMSPEEQEEFSESKKRQEHARRRNMSPEKKRESLDQHKATEEIRRKSLSPEKRKETLDQHKTTEQARRESMSPEKIQKTLDQHKLTAHIRRKGMSPEKKEQDLEQMKSCQASRRQKMSCTEKQLEREKDRDRHALKRKHDKQKEMTIQKASENFRRKCYELPEYVCTCCHRLLWKQSVLPFKIDKYDRTNDIIKRCFAEDILKETKPGELYICTTCNGDLKKKHPIMPAQAVANGLKLDPTPPPGLQKPNQMELMLFRREIPFMKMGNLPRGRQYRMQGPVVNVPCKFEAVSQLLPRLPNEAMLVPIKLKRRLCYKGHYLYDDIRPHVVMDWLKWLKEHNPHYTDVNISFDWCNLMAQCQDDGRFLFYDDSEPCLLLLT